MNTEDCPAEAMADADCLGAELGPFGERGGRVAGWLSLLWLIFMVPSFVDGWDHRDSWRGPVAMVATVAFMAVYAAPLVGERNRRRRMLLQPRLRVGLPYVGALIALGTTITVAIGANGTAAAVYIAVGAMLTLPLIVTIPLDIAVVATVLIVGHLRGWPAQGGVALGALLGSLAIFGLRGVMSRNIQLMRAHQENTSLAVAGERNEPEEWQDVAALTNADVWLTPDEAREVTATLGAALEPFRDRNLRNRPDGTRRVRVMTMLTPHPKR